METLGISESYCLCVPFLVLTCLDQWDVFCSFLSFWVVVILGNYFRDLNGSNRKGRWFSANLKDI